MSSQFEEMYGEQPESSLKITLKTLAKSNLTDSQLRVILKALSNEPDNNIQKSNSQFADH